MATMVVKNGAGGDETVEKPNGNGRAAAAASRPVALSTEDLAQIAAIVTKLADVSLSTATLAALETINAAISGTVALDGPTLAALETIELGATTLAALETIELGATTLAALENISATVTGVSTEAKQDALIALSKLVAGTNRSGAIAVGGTAQQLAAANADRRSLNIQNISAGDLWVNEIGADATADTAGSWKVPAGAVFTSSTNRAISIVGATTGQKFTATEI